MLGRTKQAQKHIIILLAAFAVMLAGTAPLLAGDPAKPRTGPASREPIVVSVEADAQKLDPAAPTDGVSFLINAHLYDRLVEFSPTGTDTVPGLAESWETSADGLRWTFHLRKGANFSDGSPINSAAVKFSFDRINDEHHPQHFPGIAWTGELFGDWYDHLETPDDVTVVIVLKRPFVPLLQTLAIPPASIVSPAWTIKVGEEMVTKPLSSGAYVLEEWKRGQYLKLRARKDYWRGAAANDVIFFRVQPDPSQTISSLRTGDSHLVVTVKPQVIGDRNKLGKATLVELPIFSLGYVILNVKKPSLSDVRVRQAMNFAVDRQNICDVLLQGTSIPATGASPPGMLGYDANKPFQYSYDIGKAQGLMREAGYSEEKRLAVTLHCFDEVRPYNTVGKLLAQRLAADLKKIYIDTKIVQMDFRGLIEMVDQRTEHEMATLGWSSDTGDPDNFIYYLFAMPTNRSNYDAGKARELMEKAQSEMDVTKRGAMYAEAEQMILKDAPAIFINHPKWIKGTNKRLRGYIAHPIANDRMFDVYLEPEK